MRVLLVITSLLVAFTWARLKSQRLAAVKRASQPDDSRFSLNNLAQNFYAVLESQSNTPTTQPSRGPVSIPVGGGFPGQPGPQPQSIPVQSPEESLFRLAPFRRCNSRSEFRQIDGTCNNLRNRRWGASKIPLLRLAPDTYEDRFNAPRVSYYSSAGRMPSARQVSVAVHLTRSNLSSQHSHLMMGYAQFLDHDITLSPEAEEEESVLEECCAHGGEGPFRGRLRECFPIPTPNDPVFTRTCIPFLRSAATPPPPGKPFIRHQLNDLTAYVDGSNVYGSTFRGSNQLRSFSDGKLKISFGKDGEERLPLDPANPPRCISQREECEFLGGDVRNSEQAGLSSMHTLLVREHNRIASEIKRLNPQFSRRGADEQIFQITRKIVGGMLQRITYNEFLPQILGPNVMRRYGLTLKDRGTSNPYSSRQDASIVTEFSTAAYRFGHSLVRQTFGATPGPQVDLDEMFEAFKTVDRYGATALLKGMTTDAMESCERFITRGLRDRLFGDELDLAALNIQRGRDHGIASWMETRRALGLRTFHSYDQMIGVTHNLDTINQLRQVYPSPRDIELFPGGVSELVLDRAVVGETFANVIGWQFRQIKRGDRFWHETNDRYTRFTTAQLSEIRKASFAGLFCENVSGAKVRNYLLLKESAQNPQVDCSRILKLDLSKWGSNKGGGGIVTPRPTRPTTPPPRPTTTRRCRRPSWCRPQWYNLPPCRC